MVKTQNFNTFHLRGGGGSPLRSAQIPLHRSTDFEPWSKVCWLIGSLENQSFKEYHLPSPTIKDLTNFWDRNWVSLLTRNFFENRRVNVNLTYHFFHELFFRDHEWGSQKNKIFVHLHKQSVILKIQNFVVFGKIQEQKKRRNYGSCLYIVPLTPAGKVTN